MPKLQPAPKRLVFDLPSDINYIDLSQCASLVNRRFYRQGLNWAVAGITLVDETGSASGKVTIDTLPNTWVSYNAWEKGFRMWDRMNEKALEVNPSAKPRFYDFKIYFDPTHVATGENNNVLPRNYANGVNSGEWIYSQYTAPTTGGLTNVDYKIHMVGGDVPTIAVGLIQNYQQSRSVPQSPDPVENIDGPYSIFTAIFDEGTVQDTEVLEDLAVTNDELPYDQMDYPGGDSFPATGERVMSLEFTGTTVSATNRVGSFNAPCGLIRIDQLTGQQLTMYIDLVPGMHRGYLCEKMTVV